MNKVVIFSKLLRIEQWYKNLVIFLPLIFTKEHLSLSLIFLATFGFCLNSSLSYIFNDWMDREKDRLHPIKKERPLASGAISGKEALLISLILSSIIFSIILIIGWFYGSIVLAYLLMTNSYSLGLKRIPFLDITMISANFALRMMAGMSHFPNTDTIPYFFILLAIIIILLTHKRRSDIKLLGEKAIKHKAVLKYYNKTNSYIFRIFAYLILISSFFFLWKEGFSIYALIGVLTQIILTSSLISKYPRYSSKPQGLTKHWTWDILLILNIGLWILVA